MAVAYAHIDTQNSGNLSRKRKSNRWLFHEPMKSMEMGVGCGFCSRFSILGAPCPLVTASNADVFYLAATASDTS
jgi:hypothetical protein